MKSIAKLKGADFLRQINKIRKDAVEPIREIGVMEIRTRTPKFTGNETPEERQKLVDEQSKKNLDDILDALLEKKPEETVKLMKLLTVPEEGDPDEPDGIDLVIAGMEILASPKVMDFLLQLLKLAQTNTES